MSNDANALKLRALARKRMAESKGGKSAPAQQSWNPFGGAAMQSEGMDAAMQKAKGLTFQDAGNFADSAVRTFANGVTFGFGDKIAAGVDAGMGQGDYQKNLAANRAYSDQARETAGTAGTIAEIGGSMLPAGALLKAGATATRLPGIVGKYLGMGIDGAALGGAMAAGNDQDIGKGMIFGGVGGVAGQAAGPVASKLSGLLNKKPKLPTVDDLAAQSKASYQQAEKAGVTIKPDAMERLRKDVYDEYADFGYHPELQPGAKVAYGELNRLSKGGNVDLKGLEGLRKIAGGGFNPVNPSNNALLGKTTSKVDDFLENLGPNDVISGDPALASSSLKEARRLWGQKAKLSRVEKLLDDAGLQAGATGSGGNIENASRQKLKTLLSNPKLTRGMTADEIEATKKAVLGSNSQNALRLLGKLSPQGNGLMMAIQAAGGVASGGMTIPLAVAGYGAKKASESMTKKNAELLKAIIAGGGSKAAVTPAKNAAQKAIEKNKELLARLLMGGAITASADR
jgi:hypothetical protein